MSLCHNRQYVIYKLCHFAIKKIFFVSCMLNKKNHATFYKLLIIKELTIISGENTKFYGIMIVKDRA